MPAIFVITLAGLGVLGTSMWLTAALMTAPHFKEIHLAIKIAGLLSILCWIASFLIAFNAK